MEFDSVAGRFERIAARIPNAVAIETSSISMTYAELSRLVDRVCAEILGGSGRPSAPIGLLLDHDYLAVAGALSTVLIGRCYVPLDVHFPEVRLREMIDISECDTILTTASHIDLARNVCGSNVSFICMEDAPSDRVMDRPALAAGDLDAPAYVLFTSGSTGTPKAVRHTHRSLLRSVDCFLEDVAPAARGCISLITPLSFTPSVFCLFGALLSGAKLCPFDLRRRGVGEISSWMQTRGISALYTTPTILRRWLGQAGPVDLPELRIVMLAGEPLLSSDVDLVRSTLPETVQIYNGMGTTETSCVARYFVSQRDVFPHGRIPIGHVYDDVDARILGTDDRVLGAGEIGELVLAAKHFAPGYLNRAGGSNPFSYDEDQDLWAYRTGDLVMREEDGVLVHCGRADAQVKIGGIRVEPDEVESIVQRLTGVTEAAVCDFETRDGTCALVAYVTLAAGSPADANGLRQEMLIHAPAHLVPAIFIVLDELPLVPSGKINRAALPAPSDTIYPTQTPVIEPGSDIDDTVLAAFRLALNQADFRFSDDFFAWGGDSLQALDIAIHVEEKLGLTISASILVTCPTPENLARHLRGRLQAHAAEQLIDLNPGAGYSAEQATIYCVPGLGGESLIFRELAKAFPDTQPIFGLQFQGAGGQVPPLQSVHLLADHFVAQITETSPTGPIVLIAFSVGGIVALEIARALKQEGRDVSHLYLVDCYTPDYFETERKQNHRQARRAAIKQQGPAWITRKLSKKIGVVWSRMTQSSDVDHEVAPSVVLEGLDLPSRSSAVRSALLKAAYNYTPQALSIDTTLFRSARPRSPEGDRYGQWDTLINAELTTISRDLDHMEFLHAPTSFVIAETVMASWPSPIARQEDDVLWSLWDMDDEMHLDLQAIPDTSIPAEVRGLLCHRDGMTDTLSRYVGGPIRLEVLAQKHVGSRFKRKVALTGEQSSSAYVLAVIDINLRAFSMHERLAIIEGKIPFGTMLNNFHKPVSHAPREFFEIKNNNVLASSFGTPEGPATFFARRNQISSGTDILADVLEIVDPSII